MDSRLAITSGGGGSNKRSLPHYFRITSGSDLGALTCTYTKPLPLITSGRLHYFRHFPSLKDGSGSDPSLEVIEEGALVALN